MGALGGKQRLSGNCNALSGLTVLFAANPGLRLPALRAALALGFPPDWKIHNGQDSKQLLRRAFEGHLPDNIVHRPKEKFSKGAGSSDLIAEIAEREITDSEFDSEKKRLKNDWDYPLQNKEALYYYKIIRNHYDDAFLFRTMGHSRSL